jgi:hypothetical protein
MSSGGVMKIDNDYISGRSIALFTVGNILSTGGFGASSESLFIALFAPDYLKGINVPHDYYDFGRCFNLVAKLSVDNRQLMALADKYPKFEYLKSWDKLGEAFVKKDYSKIYQLLHKKEA